jgi:ammonium transporter
MKDDDDTKKKTDDDDPKKSTTADDKELKKLKDDVAATKKDLAAATAALKDLQKSADIAKGAAKAAEDAKAEAAALKKTTDELAKEMTATKASIPDGKKAETDAAATTKSIKDADDKGAYGSSSADSAWILTSSAFVLFMVPGLALFYCGMVRRKNVLATMMQSMAALAVVGVYWIAVGYSLAFGPSAFQVDMGLLGGTSGEKGGLFGWSWDLLFLKGIEPGDTLPGYKIPVYLHVMFQGMFAIITPALISGAIAERIRFWPFCLFMILWVTFVYCPLAHMVWAFDWFDPNVLIAKRGLLPIGLLGKLGALDFAGGTVVHIAAGMAGLACCLVLRKRHGYPEQVAHPNSMVLTLLGAGLLWFGWFGFNGGSALNGTALAVSAFAATQAAAAAAGLGWVLVEWLHKGKPTALGLASGIVAGLVAVTPASGFVYMWGGVVIGLAAAVICYLAVNLKGMLGYDDSLDAFGVHGVGGFVGAVLTGVFCSAMIQPASADGPLAYKAHRARYEQLKPPSEGPDSTPIADAKAAVE